MRFWKPRAKRLAAMVCALALTASLLPTAVFAEPGDTVPAASSTATVEEKTEETPVPDATEEGQNTPSVPGEQPKEQPSPEPSASPVPSAEPTPSASPEVTAEPTESPEPVETPTTTPVLNEVQTFTANAPAPKADGKTVVEAVDGVAQNFYADPEKMIWLSVEGGTDIGYKQNVTFILNIDDAKEAEVEVRGVYNSQAQLRINAPYYDYKADQLSNSDLLECTWNEAEDCYNISNNDYAGTAGDKDAYTIIIDLTTPELKDNDAIRIEDTDNAEYYGTFFWAKGTATRNDCERKLEVYVNNTLKYTTIIETPESLTTREYWFETNLDKYTTKVEIISGGLQTGLDGSSRKDVQVYLTTKCECGNANCQCPGGSECDCPEHCDCPECNPGTGEHEIATPYGTISYNPDAQDAVKRSLEVEIYVNGKKEYETSKALTVSSAIDGGFAFDDNETKGYYFHSQAKSLNSYDILVRDSEADEWRYVNEVEAIEGSDASSWTPGTGNIKLVYNKEYMLRIYLYTFERYMTLDVTREVDAVDYVTGYTISYTARNPETGKEETYTYPATSFAAGQPQIIPYGREVTVTADCVPYYEATTWRADRHGTDLEFIGERGNNGSDASPLRAYGNTVWFTEYGTSDDQLQLYIEGVKEITPPSDDEMQKLLDDAAVKVSCTTKPSEHPAGKYALLDGSYDKAKNLGGNSVDNYTYTITVKPDAYVTKYNDTNGEHTNAMPETQQIVFEYVAGAWTVQTETPVEFKVTCEEVVPEKPDVSIEKTITKVNGDSVSAGELETLKVKVGDTITYQIKVANNGTGVATNVALEDTFTGNGTPGVVKDKANTDTGTWSGSTGAWKWNYTIKELAADKEKVYTYTYEVVKADAEAEKPIKNSIAATGVTPDYDDETETEVENPEVTVEKKSTVTREGKPVTVNDENPLQVDDEITYTITVKNTGNVELTGLTLTDEFNGHNEPEKTQETSQSLTWQKTSGGWTGTSSNFTLAIGQENTYRYTYTVVEEDLGNKLTNTATVTGGGLTDGDPDNTDDEELPVEDENPDVTVTKSLFAITRNGESVKVTDDIELKVGDELTYAIDIVNSGNVDLEELTVTDTFSGAGEPSVVTDNGDKEVGAWNDGVWTATIETLPVDGTVTYTYTYTVVQADADKPLTNSAVVTGEDFPDGDPDNPPPQDEEEHEVKDDGKIKLQPANMTIYMGGEAGYNGVLDGTDATTSNSLPEPGFYITLPGEVNQALGGNGHAADLSGKITVTAATTAGAERTWTLQKYGDSTSTALINDQEHFVYKIEPGEKQPAIRVAFTDNDSNTVTSDAFTLTDNLSNEYKMNLYTGDVVLESISLKIEAGDQTFYCGYDAEGSTPGKLTVRYAATNALITPATTDLDAKIAEDTEQFYVGVAEGQKFYINEQDEGADGVDVLTTDVSLLADELTGNGAGYSESDLVLTAVEEASFASGHAGAVSKYFDLVDTQNGNAWLTPTDGSTVTVFWPYPADTDKNTNFKLYHFDRLDREGTAADGASAIDVAMPTEVTSIVKGKHGITFTTSSFSPFVLTYELPEQSQPGDEDKPSGDDDNNNNNNNNNNNTNNNQNKSTASASASASATVTAPAAPAAAVIPQTGDDMPVGLLAGLALVAAGGLAALLVLRKRRSDR